MNLLRRHKYILISFSLYLPAIFLATHIPIPKMVVTNMRMNDKTMHFTAYLILVFLAWCSVSPYEKIKWKKMKPWLIIAAVAAYAAADEYLQSFVPGRSPQVSDFFADLTGTLTAVIIMSFMGFWQSLLIISAAIIFIITNLTATDTIAENILINTAFHFLGYTFFTLVWVHWMERFTNADKYRWWWLPLAVSGPSALLAIVKTTSVIMNKKVWFVDLLTAFTAIIFAAVVSMIVMRKMDPLKKRAKDFRDYNIPAPWEKQNKQNTNKCTAVRKQD